MARTQPLSDGCLAVGIAIRAHHRVLKQLLQQETSVRAEACVCIGARAVATVYPAECGAADPATIQSADFQDIVLQHSWQAVSAAHTLPVLRS